MTSSSDRRSSVRVEVHLTVEVAEAASTLHITVASDVSEGGMFIHELLPFEIGTSLRLTFKLPGLRRTVTCGAEVVHKREYFLEGMPNRPIGNGLRFTGIDAEDRSRVAEYVAARLEQ